MSTNLFPVVNPHPIVCDCPPGHGTHVHLEGEGCPVVRRWYAGPRYGQLDYGLAGVQWREASGVVQERLFHVDDGAVVVPTNLQGIPLGVFWCLCCHVGNARNARRRSYAGH